MTAAAASLAGCADRPRVFRFTADGAETAYLADRMGKAKFVEGVAVSPIASTAEAQAMVVRVKTGESYHLHQNQDHLIYMLSGRGRMTAGGRSWIVVEGDLLVVPRKVPHKFVNLDREPAVGLVFYAPPFDPKDRVQVKEKGF